MTQTSDHQRRSAFAWWLRTGRLPSRRSLDGVELKFNPWHDPVNGRFTFVGAGNYFGAGRTQWPDSASGRALAIVHRDAPKPRVATRANSDSARVERPVRHVEKPRDRQAIEARSRPVAVPRPRDVPNPITEFVGGVGEGLYGVGKGVVMGTYSALTTNPITTVREAGRGIAGMIDSAIAAEDTPARVQVSRAAEMLANASPREVGRATGVVAGNAVLAVAPGAALTRVSRARRLRMARPRTTFDPPQIGWAKENLKSGKPWKAYNDTAIGARPGQAPTLLRVMPDGSRRPVKFDGVEAEYLIDRKWSVMAAPRAVAQALRQSEALAQHRLIGVWEVPTRAKRDAAIKLLKKLGITNIKVRVVEP